MAIKCDKKTATILHAIIGFAIRHNFCRCSNMERTVATGRIVEELEKELKELMWDNRKDWVAQKDYQRYIAESITEEDKATAKAILKRRGMEVEDE